MYGSDDQFLAFLLLHLLLPLVLLAFPVLLIPLFIPFPLSIPLSILVGGNFERRKKARRSRNSRGDSNRAETLRSFLGVSRAHADADLKALLLARPWGVSKSTKDGLQDQCRLVPGARNARIKRCACPVDTPHDRRAHCRSRIQVHSPARMQCTTPLPTREHAFTLACHANHHAWTGTQAHESLMRTNAPCACSPHRYKWSC